MIRRVYLVARHQEELSIYLFISRACWETHFSCFCSDCYFKSIYEKTTHISIFTAGKCSSAIANGCDFLYETSHCKIIIGKRATWQKQCWRNNRKELASTIDAGDFVFFQGNLDEDFGEPVWLGWLVPNQSHLEFEAKPKWTPIKSETYMDNVHIGLGETAL